MKNLISKQPEIKTPIKIQRVKREDKKYRYFCNLPKEFIERLKKKYKYKKGVYILDCIYIVIENGKIRLEINETEEVI